jgi:hypothetical protein
LSDIKASRIPIQWEKILKKKNPCLLHAGLFLGLFFDPEDGGDMFLQNIG